MFLDPKASPKASGIDEAADASTLKFIILVDQARTLLWEASEADVRRCCEPIAPIG